MTMASDSASRHRLWRLVPVAALLIFTLVLRAPITVVPPLLTMIRTDLGLDAATAGLLTSIPVLAFGLLTPVASKVLARTGVNRGAMICVVGVMLGSAVRSADGALGAYAGTILIGVTLAIGNLAVPMLIGRQFQHRAELLTGAYALTTNLVVTATTALAVPAALLVGWRWTAASTGLVIGAVSLAVWVAVYPPGVGGASAWVRRRAGQPDPAAEVRTKAVRAKGSTSRITLLLTTAFAAHTYVYYALASWLPTALMETQHMTASGSGIAASLMQAAGIAGALLVPVLRAFRLPAERVVVAIGLAWVVMPAGMLFAPALWAVWSVFGGLAQAAFFTAVMAVVIRRSRDVDENRRTTAVMQTVGYSVAAVGPVLTGWVHERSGGWSVPFALILVVAVVMVGAAALAVRPAPEPARA